MSCRGMQLDIIILCGNIEKNDCVSGIVETAVVGIKPGKGFKKL